MIYNSERWYWLTDWLTVWSDVWLILLFPHVLKFRTFHVWCLVHVDPGHHVLRRPQQTFWFLTSKKNNAKGRYNHTTYKTYNIHRFIWNKCPSRERECLDHTLERYGFFTLVRDYLSYSLPWYVMEGGMLDVLIVIWIHFFCAFQYLFIQFMNHHNC